VAALPNLNPQDRFTLASGILKRWAFPQTSDWRAWNLSRGRAWQAVHENETSLKAMQCVSKN
jgi:hypothetical protein